MTKDVVSAAIPLRAVVDDPALAVDVVADSVRPGSFDLPVRWAHVSELRDPAPYLLGGELLLTAGVNLAAEWEEVDRYVLGLLDAGVTALGFGLTPPMHEVLPESLRAACVRHGLPLLVVPQRTPFLAISRAVAVALAEVAQREQRREAVAREALTKAAVDGLVPLIRELAQRLGGWAALVGAHDELVAEHRAPASWPPAELPELLARLRTGRGIRTATTELPDGTSLLAQPVSPQATASHLLVVGRRSRFDGTERAIIAGGAGLLGLAGRAGTGTAALSGATTALLLHSASPADVLSSMLPADRYHVVAGAPLRRRSKDSAADHDWLSARLRTPLVRLAEDGGFTAIVDTAPSPEVVARIREQGWLVVVGRAHGAAALRQAMPEVENLLHRARALDRPLLADGTGLGLSTVVSPESAAAFAAEALSPLHQLDPDQRTGGLFDTLRVWLAHHGNWERTATALGVHRNSVRHRIGQVERALAVDLADPEIRMELWFALRWCRAPAIGDD
ncbi:PucR family transcriptional regulator [Saccharopolyspora sp. K220]|uniref:PucR family transcriptional regulator n=1 Tax=Saccharopolyspora soli TaxID=2926618 RepID=UPI001F59F8BA|nr:PucR family transcriptional regulator [Saccharopolyspora soli]MCI2420005.1 PucR family transcriptional regulator [Saccharopolyspora soli]